MIDWPAIDTVFLDMDGTLLDLYFDNHFWLEFIPQQYAKARGLTLEDAHAELQGRYRAVEGTIDWYCLDYWTRELQLDIVSLKREIDHLIAIHPHVIDFLDKVRASGRRVVLVTNAHRDSLSLKMEKTRLDRHLDRLICSHDFRTPKEDPTFWEKLQAEEPFERGSTMLVDDSLSVLRSARTYGIAHLLAVYHPDSRGERRDVADFQAIEHFRELLPGLN